MKGISRYYDFVDKEPDSKYFDVDIRVRSILNWLLEPAIECLTSKPCKMTEIDLCTCMLGSTTFKYEKFEC